MTIALFLPRDTDEPWRWLRIGDAGVTERGEGLPGEAGAEPVTAIAPAEAVTLHWSDLPDRSPAQSVAAARILVADTAAAPLAELHVAVGREDRAERPVGVVAAALMTEWLALLARHGIDPVAVIPAPMLLPRPDAGFVRAELGNGGAVRGIASGFADEARLTELIAGETLPETLGRDEVEASIAAAIAAPALDLRQGPFGRRRRRAIDWRLIRRLAALGAAILAVTLFIDLVRIARYSIEADVLEARADTAARGGLGRGPQVGDPDRLLAERLARLRGPGIGFSRTAAVVLGAVQATEGSEVTRLIFDANGDLRVGVTADGEAQANALKRRIEEAGLTVEASPFASAGTRLSGEFAVRLP